MGDRYGDSLNLAARTELYSTDASRSRKVPATSARQENKRYVRATEIGSLSLRHKAPERIHQLGAIVRLLPRRPLTVDNRS